MGSCCPTMETSMLSCAPVAQSQADAWPLMVRHEFVAVVGSSKVTAEVPVGRGGRLDGGDEREIALGGGLSWVTVAVGAL